MSIKKGKAVAATPRTRAAIVQPNGFIPTWEIPVALRGIEYAREGGKKFVEWLAAEGPLGIQILDSRVAENRYLLEINAMNLTVNSLYIDAFTLLSPVHQVLDMAKKPVPGLDLTWALPGSGPSGPQLVRPGDNFEFVVHFPVPDARNLTRPRGFMDKKLVGSAQIRYTVLSEATSRDRKIAFALRLN
jgi:hypothetical protein